MANITSLWPSSKSSSKNSGCVSRTFSPASSSQKLTSLTHARRTSLKFPRPLASNRPFWRMDRLDQALVERGLAESREKAKRAILAGQVRVNGQVARKPSDSVRPEDQLSVTAAEKFV